MARRARAARAAVGHERAVVEDEDTTSYTLRAIPKPLWKAAKIRAVKDSLDMRSAILQLLEYYAKKGMP